VWSRTSHVHPLGAPAEGAEAQGDEAVMSLLRRFAECARGGAGIEFAIIAPGMIALLFGMIEVNELIAADNRTHNIATALADVTSRDVAITNAEMTGAFDAAGTVVFPGAADRVRMRITAVTPTGPGQGEALWSDGRGFSPYAAGATVTMPPQVDTPCAGPSVMFAEAEFDFKSPAGIVLGMSTYTLKQKVVMCPRVVNVVSRDRVS